MRRPFWLALLAALGLITNAHAQATKPNILFCIADDWSAPHTGAYGSKFVKTPGFDRIAKEGVLFRNAFVTSPGCSPSRASLLTGKQPWQLREAGTHASSFPADLTVYPQILRRAGYFIGLVGKGWGPGNFKIAMWEHNPAGPNLATKKLDPPHKGMSTIDYAGSFREFLKQRPKDAPFCFWYGGSEPHRPYDPGMGLRAGKTLEQAEVPPFLPDSKEVRSDLLDYAVEIEWFDKHLLEMIRALEEIGELDNTIIVVTGDNGMSFPYAKANLTEYGIHVPLAIRWGAAKGGRTVDDLVSLIDLAPTYLEAAGIKPPADMKGASLVSLLKSDKSGVVEGRDSVYAGRERHSSSRAKNLTYPSRCLRTPEYLYVRNFAPDRWPAGDPDPTNKEGGYFDIDSAPSKAYLWEHRDDAKVKPFFELAVAKRPAEQLFDLKKDPGCLVNVADKSEYAQTRKTLAARLDAYLRNTNDLRVTGGGDVWETYPRYSPIRKFPGDK
jgi:uncharacterized sulfatase